MCCQQVENLFTEVREYVDTSGLVWNQENWLRKLIKSHSRGIGLSQQTCRPFNRLQRFIWLALGRGLTVREDYAPFAPVFISTTVTEASSIGGTQGGPNEAQDVGSDRSRRAPPQETPPWQTPPGSWPEPEEAGAPRNPQSSRESETHRESAARDAGRGAAARDAGSQYWSKGGKRDGGSNSGKGSTPVAQSEVGSLGREAKVPASGKRVRPETEPEGRGASDRSRSDRSLGGGSRSRGGV